MSKFDSRFTPIDDDYGTCEWTAATLAIYDIDPAIISTKLNITPSSSETIGKPRIMPSGVERIGTNHSWLFSTKQIELNSKDLRTHLNWLLDKIEPFETGLKELQQITGVKMAIRCSWRSKYGDGGPTLWPEQMERMAKLNLELTMSFLYEGYGLELSED